MNNEARTVPAQPPSLCVAAREEAMLERERKKKKNVAKQVACVKRILGKEFFSQCVYNEISNDWFICSHRFICGPSAFFDIDGDSDFILSGTADFNSPYFGTQIESLADLGEYLEKQDRKDAEMRAELVKKFAAPAAGAVLTMKSQEAPFKAPWYERLIAAFTNRRA